MEPFDQPPSQLPSNNIPKPLSHTIQLSFFIPSIIVAVVFTAGLVLLWNHLNQPVNRTNSISTLTSGEVISPTSSPPTITNPPFPTTASTHQPTSTPRPTSTPVVTTGKLSINFRVLYTSENIDNYSVTIYKQSDQSIVSTATGNGNNYSADNLTAGSYKIHVQIGRNGKYCGNSGNGVDSSAVPFEIKAGQTTNFTADIYPYPGFIYLKTKNGFPIANATVNTGFYSTTTDVLGRAVLYNINPGPYNLSISYPDGNFNFPIADNNCLWTQIIRSSLASTSSDVSVTINPTVSYISLAPELIIKAPPLDIKPSAVGNLLVYGDVVKYSFELSHCPELDSTYYRFGGMTSLYSGGSPGSNNTGNTVTLSQIDPGNYNICVYNSANPDSSYASSQTSIVVKDGNPVQTAIDYPKK